MRTVIRRGRLAFVAEVRSPVHVLGQTVGRTFQTTCDAALGDARCGADLEDPAFKGAGGVIDLLRDRAFTASGLGAVTSGWFTFGTLDWTSGANTGRRTELLGHDVTDGVAILTLLEAPVRAITEGNAFTSRATILPSGGATVGSETGLVAVCPTSGRGGSGGGQACPGFGDLVDSCRKDEETARSVKDRLNRSSAP
ncbi:DUF2163 domain-containing protein [Amaricoccus sp. B4]|uniref:baseplate hub domain-containing protein n=1 Tax=Amaricoccus sp. B4 TaxID=3368557 RepID=UPI003712CE09